MRKILRLFIILFIFGLVWNFIESPVYAKSYSITSDQFIINILADKSVLVKEDGSEKNLFEKNISQYLLKMVQQFPYWTQILVTTNFMLNWDFKPITNQKHFL